MNWGPDGFADIHNYRIYGSNGLCKATYGWDIHRAKGGRWFADLVCVACQGMSVPRGSFDSQFWIVAVLLAMKPWESGLGRVQVLQLMKKLDFCCPVYSEDISWVVKSVTSEWIKSHCVEPLNSVRSVRSISLEHAMSMSSSIEDLLSKAGMSLLSFELRIGNSLHLS
jgi:hypothetical protein